MINEKKSTVKKYSDIADHKRENQDIKVSLKEKEMMISLPTENNNRRKKEG
jgi:hypothetical protein